jgi:D-tyrosyl-tRNA(Tyr) deacylase
MRVLIQRVSNASVMVDQQTIGSIETGLLVLLGIENEDKEEDANYLIQKISQLRIFNDANEKMNLSIQDINGAFLIISQFTLHASTKKGNRPSFIQAAKPEIALPLYQYFIQELKDTTNLKVEKGEFGADMKVSLINDGPVTIWMDSKNKV